LPIAHKSYVQQILTASKVSQEPLIDGLASDEVWKKSRRIITHDKAADIDMTVKAVYTDKRIFFLVSYPDKDESLTHCSWTWNPEKKEYELGWDREDVFVIKWSMENKPVDLSVYADNPYTADVWFWKACRTDHHDDIQFDIKDAWRFGFSRYEIAGRKEEPLAIQPKYGCGDITEKLTFKFSHN
jgi:hypothetical protein